MTSEAFVAIHHAEGLLVIVTRPAELPSRHLVHGQLVASLLHLEDFGMAIGTPSAAGEVLHVLKGDGSWRTGIGREGDGGRACRRGCLRGRGSAELVALGTRGAGIVLGFVGVTLQACVPRLGRPCVRSVAGRATGIAVHRGLVKPA